MQISISHSTETQVKLTVVAAEKDLAPLKSDVLKRFQQQIKLPGFRKGKVPLALVEKNVDQNQLQTTFLEEAINQMYGVAVTEKKLRPVSNPEISIKSFVPFTELSFEAIVEVIGQIVIPDYKKLKKNKLLIEVTEEDVVKVIGQLQERVAQKNDVERPAATGDNVWIDFSGVDKKGQPVQGAEGKNTPILLGSDTFIPGFEANLVGLTAGQSKTFTVTFPKEYGVKALANRPVTFNVTVIKVQEVVQPELNDEFAAKIGPFESLSALKDDIKKQIKAEREQEAQQAYENEIIRELAKRTKIAVPKILVDEQIDRIEEGEKQNILYRGQTWQEHLQEEGLTEEAHREQKRPEAEERVRASLALSAIAEKEDVNVSDEEIMQRLTLFRERYTDPQAQADLAKPDVQRDIASRLLTEKTIARLVELIEAA